MNRNITLEFSKRGQSTNDIGLEDAFEIGHKATEYLQCLGFLINNLNLRNLEEDNSELETYFMPLGEMIYAFSSQAFWMLDTLENHRKETEVKQDA